MKLAQYLLTKATRALGKQVTLPPTIDIRKPLEEAAKQVGKESGAVVPSDTLHVSPAGIALMHAFEGCARLRPDGKYEAYPDPGSSNGLPWTIGWGSTGKGIGPGTVWTKAQCDTRFERDLERYASDVRKFIGTTPTTQGQFDALVAFHYNTGAIFSSTLGRKHKAKDYAGAAQQFDRWIYNDGTKLAGLVRRRKEERKLYES